MPDRHTPKPPPRPLRSDFSRESSVNNAFGGDSSPENFDDDKNQPAVTRSRRERSEMGAMDHRYDTITLFRELGYDLNDHEERRRLAEDLRWAAEKRKQEITFKSQRWGLLVSLALVAIGSGLAVLSNWVSKKFIG